MGDAFFGILYLANSRGRPRLGMAVAVRTVGNAARRNRIRRIVRESFRLHQHELPAVDVIVNARAAARDADNDKLFASLKRLWGQIRIP
jgi:ribonuclease P protein component